MAWLPITSVPRDSKHRLFASFIYVKEEGINNPVFQWAASGVYLDSEDTLNIQIDYAPPRTPTDQYPSSILAHASHWMEMPDCTIKSEINN